MVPRRRKLVLFLFALLVIAVIAIGVNYYVWHQARVNRTAADLNLQLSDAQFNRATGLYIGNPEKAAGVTFDTQLMPYSSTRHGVSNPQIDQQVDEFDNDIYCMLSEALRNEFPELNLSQPEIVKLSETILLLRKTLLGLRNMDRAMGNDHTFRQLEALRDHVIWEFERIIGMGLQEFLMQASAVGGLSNEHNDAEDIILESLSNYQP